MSLRKSLTSLLQKLEKNYATYNRIEVSKSALMHNLALFQKQTHQQVIPVLKANAYGHGIELVAEALEGQSIPYIAVDGYFEACRIREVSSQPVLIMGAIKPENFSVLNYDNFAFVIHDEAAVRGLGETGKRIKVHLECNTGMNRYGARPVDMARLARLILDYPNLELEGIMSHLADSDGEDASTVETAVTAFDECVESIHAAGARPPMIHIAQTAGSLKAKSKYATAIRLGIGLYGVNPFPDSHPLHAALHDLRPALSLISTITQIIQLEKGDKVSYNYTFTAPKAMKIGVLPLGYYEGVNRDLSNRGVVKINDHFTPIVGRICMNHTIVSLEGIEARNKAEVIVYSSQPGDKNTIDHIASDYQLFNYNLLASLSPDVRRVLVP